MAPFVAHCAGFLSDNLCLEALGSRGREWKGGREEVPIPLRPLLHGIGYNKVTIPIWHGDI